MFKRSNHTVQDNTFIAISPNRFKKEYKYLLYTIANDLCLCTHGRTIILVKNDVATVRKMEAICQVYTIIMKQSVGSKFAYERRRSLYQIK